MIPRCSTRKEPGRTKQTFEARSLARAALCAPRDCKPAEAPLSTGLSRQAYWSGLPFPPPGDLPDPGMEPVSAVSPAMQARSSPTELWGLSLKERAFRVTRVKCRRKSAESLPVPVCDSGEVQGHGTERALSLQCTRWPSAWRPWGSLS